MRKGRRCLTVCVATIGLLLLIVDTSTAVDGALSGIKSCIYTLIPSMFPFLILSSVLVKSLSGVRIPILRPVSMLCGIPDGAEALALVGLIGGYPVGAKLISDAYQADTIHKADAERLLGFCSNAGPAFVFGVIGSLFHDPIHTWSIWVIHILSAILVGCVFSERPSRAFADKTSVNLNITTTVESCTRTMAVICAWVIIFRVILTFFSKWFLYLLPISVQALIAGLLELTNGCITLAQLDCLPVRFIICSVILSFGGLCVLMQTTAVTTLPGCGLYFPGKVLQCIFSFLLSGTAQCLLFPKSDYRISVLCFAGILLLCAGILVYKKFHLKNSRFYTNNVI